MLWDPRDMALLRIIIAVECGGQKLALAEGLPTGSEGEAQPGNRDENVLTM